MRELSVSIVVLFLLGPFLRGDETDPVIEGKKLSELVALLQSNREPFERVAAIRALSKAGPKNRIALRALVRAGFDRTPQIKEAALDVFPGLGPPVIPTLVDLLKDTESMVQGGAALALGKLGPAAKGAIPQLVEAYRTSTRSAYLRLAFPEAMAQIGPDALPALVEGLKDSSFPIRQGMAKGIRALGAKAKPALADIQKHLQTETSPAVRNELVAALEAIGVQGTDAVPVLLSRLRSQNIQTKIEASRQLARMGAPVVPAVVRGLKDADSSYAHQCLTVLRQMKPEDVKEAAPALIAILGDEKSSLRHEAAAILGRLGPVHNDVVPALRGLLKTKYGPYESAVKALGDLGPASKEAIPDLLEIARTGRGSLRTEAIVALGRIGEPAVPTVLKLLKETDDESQQLGVSILHGAGKAYREAIPTLLDTLAEVPEETRKRIVDILYRMGTDALPGLIKGLKHEEVGVRKEVAGVLARLGRQAGDAVPALIEALRDDSPAVRTQAVQALALHRDHAEKSVPALLALCKEEDLLTVREASKAVVQLAGADGLFRGLKDPDRAVRLAMVDSLSSLDSLGGIDFAQRTRIHGGLVHALGDENVEVRSRAAAALMRWQIPMGNAAVTALVKLLEDQDRDVRINATRTLGAHRAQAQSAVEPLLKLASTAKGEERHAAVAALTLIGADPEKFLPLLLAISKEKIDPKTLQILVGALASLRDKAKEGVPILASAVKSDDRFLRSTALRALGDVGPAAREAVPAIVTLLESKDTSLLYEAIGTLARIGPGAKDALPALIELAKSPTGMAMRFTIVDAVRRIDPDSVNKVPPRSGM